MVSGRRSVTTTSAHAGGGEEGHDSNLPPVSSKSKDYTERPAEVMDELDELRTRVSFKNNKFF